jgi:hypothetical protein
MDKQYRINVYDDELLNEKIIARVRYNAILDYWDGHNWRNGNPGKHKGLTKLKDGRYVLINGSDWQGDRDFGIIISKDDALQEILKSQNLDLLKMKKWKDLKKLYDKKYSDLEDLED